MRTTLKAAVGAACALALVPAAASADSIAYVKDGNVWIANPDGSGQYQVTRDANEQIKYYSPSQADDGTIVAAHGEEIVRLEQNGKVLSRFNPPPVKNSVGSTSDGVPVDLAVSPDGSKVAYTFYSVGCPVAVSCGARGVVAYSYSDRETDPATFGWTYNVRTPEWVTNDRVLTTGGYLRHANFDSPDGGVDDFQNWFNDDEEDVNDAEITRQGDRVAYLRSYGERTHLALRVIQGDARTSVPPAPTPDGGCDTGTDATLDDPTWSPDGEKIGFADSNGIEVLDTPRAEPCTHGPTRVVVAGGSEPDWGPADVNPGPREDEHVYPPACGKHGFCTPPPSPARAPKLALFKSKLRIALAKGLPVLVQTNGEGDVKVEFLSGKKVVAKGSDYVDGGWSARVKAKFTRAAKKSLAKKRSVKLVVRVTWKPASGESAQQSTAKLTLRR